MTNKVERLAANFELDSTRQTLMRVVQDQIAVRGLDDVRAAIENQSGERVWNSEQLMDEFEVSHFDPPYVHVIRKADAVAGTVVFNDDPRFYFAFKPTKGNHGRGET
ncbi:MAG: hypothetical protein EBT15_03940 [Betaproteobacteria bacterium]|nr:hypothetical protein [Betaproteobacteria bacterium]